MFKSSTEGVNSLTVDDVARQAVPESGTSSAEGSIANSHKPRSWHLDPDDAPVQIGADACWTYRRRVVGRRPGTAEPSRDLVTELVLPNRGDMRQG